MGCQRLPPPASCCCSTPGAQSCPRAACSQALQEAARSRPHRSVAQLESIRICQPTSPQRHARTPTRLLAPQHDQAPRGVESATRRRHAWIGRCPESHASTSELLGRAMASAKRHHRGMEGRENERELYQEIIRRAKRVRERTAEQLKRSRALRKRQGDLGTQAGAARKQRRGRRQD